MWYRLIIVLGLIVLVIPASLSAAQVTDPDVLLYVLEDSAGQPGPWMLWSAQTGEHTLLLDAAHRTQDDRFVPHPTGRIAYLSRPSGNQDILVFDVVANPPEATNITQTPALAEYGALWSPDGQALAFTQGRAATEFPLYLWDGAALNDITPVHSSSAFAAAWSQDSSSLAISTFDEDQAHRLYIWDETTHRDITPTNLPAEPMGYEVTWSPAGGLAATAWYHPYDYLEPGYSEVFYWDGTRTTHIENPIPRNEFVALGWNQRGQLALRTSEGSKGDIFIWDGVSVTANGAPDMATFEHIAPGLTTSRMDIVWTNDGRPTISADIGSQAGDDQIVMWDHGIATDISQNSGYKNVLQTWTEDGRWAFQTLYSREQLVYVKGPDNQTLFVAEGHLPMWSPGGLLAYCAGNSLLVWDGQTVTRVAQASFGVEARWLNGTRAVCSDG